MTTNCTNREPSDAEMNGALEALARWQTPGEFASKVKAFDSLVKSSTLFNKANAGFVIRLRPCAHDARSWHLEADQVCWLNLQLFSFKRA